MNSISRARLFGAMAVISICQCCAAGPAPAGERPDDAPLNIEVLTLSRGSGVPESTRVAFDTIAREAENARQTGGVTAIQRARIGLEGETRLCVRFRDPAVREEYARRWQSLSDGVELMQLREGGCPDEEQ